MYFYSHRGNRNLSFRENRIEAILDSIQKDYISGVEFDVRFTKDKKIILYHNPSILINDSYYFISNLSFYELSKYTNVVEITNLLSKIKSSKKIIIDVKYEGKLQKEDIDIFYKTIEKYNHLNISICSFHYPFIKSFKKKYKDYECGLLISQIINYFHINNSLDFYSIRKNLYKKIPKNKFHYIWTVNTKEELKLLDKSSKNKNLHIITDNAYLYKENT